MATTKTRVTLLLALMVCAFLASQTHAHLRVGKRILEPMKELTELIQDEMDPGVRRENLKNWQYQNRKPRIDKIPKLYRDEMLDN